MDEIVVNRDLLWLKQTFNQILINRSLSMLSIIKDNKISTMDNRISNIENKMEKVSEDLAIVKVSQAETNGKIDTVKAQIVGIGEKFDQRFETVEARITGVDDHLGQAEFINRGVLVSLTVAIIGGVAKLVFG